MKNLKISEIYFHDSINYFNSKIDHSLTFDSSNITLIFCNCTLEIYLSLNIWNFKSIWYFIFKHLTIAYQTFKIYYNFYYLFIIILFGRQSNYRATDRYQFPDPSESFLALFTINLFFFIEVELCLGTNETHASLSDREKAGFRVYTHAATLSASC